MRAAFLLVLLPLSSGCTDIQFRLLSDTSDGAVPQPNLIFVGSDPVLPVSTTRALADAHCNRLAQEAGLSGMFAAWYGLDGGAAFVPFVGSRGWVRVDGLPVADTLDNLKEGPYFRSISLDENGNDVRTSGTPVFTGTEPDGDPAANPAGNCDGLNDAAGTVISGSPAAVTQAMFSSSMVACNEPARLYCLGFGRSVEVTGP